MAKLNVERTAPVEDYLQAPGTVVWLNSIIDVEERLVAAHDLAASSRKHHPEMAALRARRVYAIRVLNQRFGWRPAAIRQLIGVRLGKGVRISDALRLEYDLPLGERPESIPEVEETEEWARMLLRTAHYAVSAREGAAAAARAVRQDLVRAMVRSERWTNLDLQELTGMSSARVSQVLCGTSNLRGKTTRARLDSLEEKKQVAELTAALLGRDPIGSLKVDRWVRDNLLFMGVYTVQDLEGWSRRRLQVAGLSGEAVRQVWEALGAAGEAAENFS